MEPPQGVRANLTRTYSELPPSFLVAEGRPPPLAKAWRGLVFSAALFHALVQVLGGFGVWGGLCLMVSVLGGLSARGLPCWVARLPGSDV